MNECEVDKQQETVRDIDRKFDLQAICDDKRQSGDGRMRMKNRNAKHASVRGIRRVGTVESSFVLFPLQHDSKSIWRGQGETVDHGQAVLRHQNRGCVQGHVRRDRLLRHV